MSYELRTLAQPMEGWLLVFLRLLPYALDISTCWNRMDGNDSNEIWIHTDNVNEVLH